MDRPVLRIKKGNTPAGSKQLIQTGIPLPQGECFDVQRLSLRDNQNNRLTAYFETRTLWPDNSTKWLFARFNVNFENTEEVEVFLDKSVASIRKVINRPVIVTKQDDQLHIKTVDVIFSLDLKHLSFPNVSRANQDPVIDNGYCLVETHNYGNLSSYIENYSHQTHYDHDLPISAEVTLKGAFIASENTHVLNYQASFLFHYATNSFTCDFSIHNPKAAKHPDGIWDLGEPASILINQLIFGFRAIEAEGCDFKISNENNWSSCDRRVSIYQESSGGEHWNSPIHKNRHNQVPLKQPGFQLECDGEITDGKRANPVFKMKLPNTNIYCQIENFWQNFPKSLTFNNNEIQFGIFPSQYPDEIELQPGEKKTHRIHWQLGHDEPLAASAASLEVTLNPDWLDQCNALPYSLATLTDNKLNAIIQTGIEGNYNFFAKREAIDEYGWRNFGELFADHETAYYEGDELFISHYNNQYDPIYGFLMQFLATGNSQWLTLATDLAHHVLDIDIYHTNQDKDDYNDGLFWHTDHYLDAGTATHRSFSKLQPKDAYMDHAGGGGPGGQHGYTSGLLLFHLVTGNLAAKQAVISLTKWLERYYDGTDSFLGFLNAIKNRYRADLKDISTGQYPLDRGTGNYINALLDKYSLTQDITDLNKVAHVIRHTVHPLDDIANRDLLNIEESWFYSVFFQTVCRFLHIKQQHKQLDDDFYYARDSLLHYADWMVENEYFYLDKPEVLEFANHTWTAQEIRKVVVLRNAHYYSSFVENMQNKDRPEKGYQDKADQLLERMTQTLNQESSVHFTRIQAILMQNIGYACDNFQSLPPVKFDAPRSYPEPVVFDTTFRFKRLARLAAKNLFTLSVKREISWLKRYTSLLDRFS